MTNIKRLAIAMSVPLFLFVISTLLLGIYAYLSGTIEINSWSDVVVSLIATAIVSLIPIIITTVTVFSVTNFFKGKEKYFIELKG